MKIPKGFITADYHIQMVIGIACIILSFVLYGLMLLLPFGIWQVISSLVLVLGYNDKKRIPHLIFVAIWSVLLGIMLYFGFDGFAFYFFYIILLPACVGIWYFTMTRKDYLIAKGDKAISKEEMDEILDIEL